MTADGLVRVFPRRTSASPTDALAFFDEPPLFLPDNATEVHVSVAFTYDLPRAEWLARSWERVGLPATVGGPATGQRGEEFVPGRYMAHGHTITSRGCPNRCWFCSVWRRDGDIRELPIHDGWLIHDDNLLACSEGHIRAVCAMLARQPKRADFRGGLEAKLLQRWHVELFAALRPAQMWFAYDTPDDLPPLVEAGKLLSEAGITVATRVPRCYVLIGGPKDTQDAAEKRLRETVSAGFVPMAMLWKNATGDTDAEWRRFSRSWARLPAIMTLIKEGETNDR
jgi:hypothetical protein